MKAKLMKLIAALAAILLVVPFVAVALLVGSRVVAGAEGVGDELSLLALAIVGAALSVVKNMKRRADGERDMYALHIAGESPRGESALSFKLHPERP